jgi:hypothetical protein
LPSLSWALFRSQLPKRRLKPTRSSVSSRSRRSQIPALSGSLPRSITICKSGESKPTSSSRTATPTDQALSLVLSTSLARLTKTIGTSWSLSSIATTTACSTGTRCTRLLDRAMTVSTRFKLRLPRKINSMPRSSTLSSYP